MACAISIIIFYFFNINKGFNLLDEGFYLLGGANPLDSRQQFTASHYYLHLLMQISDNIIFLRAFSFTLNVITIITLAISFQQIIKMKNYFNELGVTTLMVCSMISVMSINLMAPSEPNYNNLTISGSIIFYSCLIQYVMNPSSRSNYIYLFIIGFTAVFVFFNKFTTGLFLLALAFISYSACSYKIRIFNYMSFLFLVSGAVLHFIIFFNFMQTPYDFFKFTRIGISLMEFSGHSSHLLLDYCLQIWDFVCFSLKKYQLVIYVTIVLLTLSKYTRLGKLKFIKRYIINISFILIFILSIKINNILTIDITSFYFVNIVTLVLISILHIDHSPSHRFKVSPYELLVLLLFFFPFLIAVGTNNPIYNQVALSFFLWMPVITILSISNAKIIGDGFKYLPLVGITLLSTYYSLYNFIYKPYGLYDVLEKQTYLTRVGNTNLYLDLTTKNIIENTRSQLNSCGFKPNNYLISLTDVPGLTYAVNARSPYCPWYLGIFVHDGEFIKKCLELTPKINSPYILLDSFTGQNKGFTEDQLDKYFKNFKTTYALCGEIKHIPTTGGDCCKVPISNIKIYKPVSFTIINKRPQW